MKLCAFPNDPLQAYYDKGEIKERYYNPKDVFDEIHFISLIEKDIEISKIQTIGGTAKIIIHSVGKINIRNRKKFVKKIIELVSEINPDVIRSYNPFIEGWLAANCAKKLKKPFVLSLHTQIDYKRKLARKRSLKKYLVLKYFEKKIEPYVIKNANKILIVYKNIEPYVKKHKGQNIEVLHNNIEINKFRNAGSVDLPKPLILSVGNLSEDKNHQCLINAMQKVEATCMIIGRGKKKRELLELIESLNLKNKIIMKDTVPYEDIPKYYKSANIFALAYDPELEGVPKPVIEAMASGLPIVIPHPQKLYSEGLEKSVIFAERNPDDFRNKINQILNDNKLQKELTQRALEKSKEFDNTVLENREAEIYLQLIKQKKLKKEVTR